MFFGVSGSDSSLLRTAPSHLLWSQTCSLHFASVVGHILFPHALPTPQQHADAVLSHGEVLTRDCVDVCRQLGLHYVEEKLVVLSCLHCRIVIVSLRAPCRAFVVRSAVSHVEPQRV